MGASRTGDYIVEKILLACRVKNDSVRTTYSSKSRMTKVVVGQFKRHRQP